MSAVGWIGLGRLGAPCAAALAHYGGHSVYGYDLRGTDTTDYDWEDLPPVHLVNSVANVVAETDDVVYVAVQTPHTADHSGETVAPPSPREFEYAYLIQAVRDVCLAALLQGKPITLAVVSTVLPGTFNRELRPLLNEFVTPVYHPFLIAMGTTVDDFVSPEMTIFGVDQPDTELVVRDLYQGMHTAPAPTMSIASAELAKVAYNTFITSKIVFSNTMMEFAEATGADVDDVLNCLALGTDRITSARYMRAGMGDGGACHPRDNLALSALATRHNVSFDFPGAMVRAREAQTRWLADIIRHWCSLTQLPVVLLGQAYKPNVDLVDGSPALLLATQLEVFFEKYTHIDPVVWHSDKEHLEKVLEHPHVYVIATNHEIFRDIRYPEHSVVIDPFGDIKSQPGIILVRPGRHSARV